MKHKKLLIFGIALILIGAITLSTVHNLEISKKENIKQYNEITKKEVKEELYKLNNDGTIYFKDKNLEKTIKETTKVDILTPQAAEKINVLILANNNNIKYLNGIEFFKNVTHLNLSYNQINDITPLKHLTKLETLKLSHNQIESIDPIKNNLQLINLNLDYNLIKDISPLKKLENLEKINLGKNQIKDISPLKNLNKLKYLPNINNNPIINLDILEKKLDLYKSNNKKDEYFEVSESMNNETGIYELEILTEFYNSMEDCRGPYIDCIFKKQDENSRKIMKEYKETIKIAKDFINQNIKDNMSDIEKEAIISKYLMDKIKYNIELSKAENYEYDPYTNELGYGFDAYYPIVKGEGVCHHYAQAFNLMAALAGLESFSAESPCTDDECSKDDAHEWNIVKIDNRYYHIDLTWEDDGFGGFYINRSTKGINENHTELGNFTETIQTKRIDLTKDMDIKKVRKYFYPDQNYE